MADEFGIEPLEGGIGAVMTGWASARAEDLRNALTEHGLLLLRGHEWCADEMYALALLFGRALHSCPQHARFHPSPGLFVVSNVAGRGNLDIGHYWHSDGAMYNHPTYVTLHHIREPGASGGETRYADLAKAHDVLGDAARARYSNVSYVSGTPAALGRGPVRHNLVRRHPVTQRRGIYVNLEHWTAYSLGCDRIGSLNAELGAVLDRPDVHYRHAWQRGDLVIADNFRVAHHASPATGLRILHRVTVDGRSAWYCPASAPAHGGQR